MINFFQQTYDAYLGTFTFADKRVEKWPLMSSFRGTFTGIVLYLIFVAFGPKFMQNRKPINLRCLLISYNISMVLLNGYMFIELAYLAYKMNYSLLCQPVDYSYDQLSYRMAKCVWLFYFSKLIEFSDTGFFILRKKLNQLTFLHVYHHSTMFFFWWIGVKWVAGGSAFFGATINCFIHVLMYAYYALAAVFPNKHFWWKRYLTSFQMIQFIVILIHTACGLYIDCPFPRWMGFTIIGYMISFLVLFGNFYIQAYLKAGKFGQNEKTDSSLKFTKHGGRKKKIVKQKTT